MGHRMNIPGEETLAGLKDVENRLLELVDGMSSGSVQGLADAAYLVLNTAAQRVPVVTGNLRGSGYVELGGQRLARGGKGGCEITGVVPEDATVAEIGFDAKNAADQHEQVGYDHPQGEAKFLESAMEDSAEQILQIIAERVWEAAEKGGES